MHRLFPYFLILLLCLSGCTQEPQAPELPRIGYSISEETAQNDPQYVTLLEQALSQPEWTVQQAQPALDHALQVSRVRELLKQGCDAVVVEPVMAGGADELIALAKEASVPILFIRKEPDPQVLAQWERACYVGCDAQLAAHQQGQLVLQLPDRGDLNGDGILSYAVICGPSDDLDAQARTLHCTQRLIEQNLPVELIATGGGQWSREQGEQACAYLLSKYGRDIEVFFCNDDTLALGALAAIEASDHAVGRDHYLIGCGGTPEALELIQAGRLTGTVSTDLSSHMQTLTLVLQGLLDGQQTEQHYYIPYTALGSALSGRTD